MLALSLFAGAVLPLLANGKQNSEQVACMNNLRHIGQAVSSWASLHDNRNPWWVSVNDEGLSPMGSGAAWMVFTYLMKEIGTPRVLVCPSDSKKFLAKDWSTTSAGGFLHNNYQNNAVSYFIGLHSYFEYPSSILSGDRNIRGRRGPENCAAGINNASGILPADPQVGWTNTIHMQRGNLLLNSGAVQPVFNQGLSNLVRLNPTDTNGALHMLVP